MRRRPGGEEAALFERFARGSAGRSGPAGTGLGLAIVDALAGRWRGRARVENRPRRHARRGEAAGSRFGWTEMQGRLLILVLAVGGVLIAASIGYAAYLASRDSVGLPVTKLDPAPSEARADRYAPAHSDSAGGDAERRARDDRWDDDRRPRRPDRPVTINRAAAVVAQVGPRRRGDD